MRRGKEAQAIQKGRRKLSVVFETLEGFREEFRSNLVRGGLFVPTAAPFVLREEVEVSLDLAFRPGAGFRLPAEVVTVVPAELASAGATPGVALQIQLAAHEIRSRLEAVVGQVPDPDPGQQVGERRCAPRRPARVLGRLASDDASFAVRTRDLSESGVLVSIEGIPPVPVGRSVALALVHPVTGQKLEVEGTVVRHLESDGGVTALAVAFSRVQAERIEVRRFVEDLQSASHARSLAGIHGPIQEVGLAGLLQSFAAAASRGTLTVTRNTEEGRVAFDGGELVTAVCGAVSGSKALARLLAWETGTFEFHAHLDDSPKDEPRLPLEVALLDAARQVDEARRFEPLPLRLSDRLARAPGAQPEDGPHAKTEAAILDLAGAGFTLRAVLDVIPDEDHKILRALLALLERAAVTAASS